MHAGDLDAVTAVHMSSFPGFFLTFLGSGFIRLLYDCVLGDPEGVAFVAVTDSGTIGFAIGVVHQTGFYRRILKRHKWRFAWQALRTALAHPQIIPRLVRALRRPATAKESAAEACLMSVAVDPSYQGHGIGSALVEAFCEELCIRGVSQVCLTTDSVGNESVNRFYQAAGFALGRQHVTPEGRQMNEYVRSLHGEHRAQQEF
jgi:GNAT superfamily N-acetyltransferase